MNVLRRLVTRPKQVEQIDSKHRHRGCGGEVQVIEWVCGIYALCDKCRHRWDLLDSLNNVTGIPKGRDLIDRI